MPSPLTLAAAAALAVALTAAPAHAVPSDTGDAERDPRCGVDYDCVPVDPPACDLDERSARGYCPGEPGHDLERCALLGPDDPTCEPFPDDGDGHPDRIGLDNPADELPATGGPGALAPLAAALIAAGAAGLRRFR